MSLAPRLGVSAAGAGLYVASLFLPVAAPFNPTYGTQTFPGYVAFRAWKTFTEWEPERLDWWVFGISWLANPAVWVAVGCALAGRWRAGAVAAGAGVVFSLVVLPRYYPMVAGLPGYWAWLGSAGTLLLGCLVMKGRAERARRNS